MMSCYFIVAADLRYMGGKKGELGGRNTVNCDSLAEGRVVVD
jgi:hypothetical protein